MALAESRTLGEGPTGLENFKRRLPLNADTFERHNKRSHKDVAAQMARDEMRTDRAAAFTGALDFASKGDAAFGAALVGSMGTAMVMKIGTRILQPRADVANADEHMMKDTGSTILDVGKSGLARLRTASFGRLTRPTPVPALQEGHLHDLSQQQGHRRRRPDGLDYH